MNDIDAYRLHSLNHTLDIIEVLAAQGSEMGLGEITERVALSKSAVHRILTNLAARGYVDAVEGGRYRLAIRFWEIGLIVFSRWGVLEHARPQLHELLEQVHENVLFSIYDRGEVIYIDKAESDHDVRAYSPVGGRAPAYGVASGLVLLAHQAQHEIDRVSSNMERLTANTIVDPQELKRLLVEIKQRGYAVNLGQRRIDINGVAAPITDATHQVRAAISISGPAYRFGEAEIERAIEPLLEVADRISTKYAQYFDSERH